VVGAGVAAGVDAGVGVGGVGACAKVIVAIVRTVPALHCSVRIDFGLVKGIPPKNRHDWMSRCAFYKREMRRLHTVYV